MKTTFIILFLTATLVSCVKENTLPSYKKPQTIIIKVETVKGDGTVEYSPSVSVKM